MASFYVWTPARRQCRRASLLMSTVVCRIVQRHTFVLSKVQVELRRAGDVISVTAKVEQRRPC
eukprot:7861775-Lingulodinium_polyedra.AAC.1